MTALAALAGLVAGTCLVLAWWSYRGDDRAVGAVGPDPYALPRPPRVDLVGLRLGLAVGAGLVVAVVTRWPVMTVVGAAGGFLLPSLGRGRAAHRRDVARVEAVAVWAEMLRDVLSAGSGLEQSIVVTADVAPRPIAAEVARLAARIDGGEDLVEALLRFSAELASGMADQVVAALVLAARRSPGHLADLLSTLAEVARDKVALRRKVDAGRAHIRTSLRWITAITVGLGGALILFNRNYTTAYRSWVGQAVLVAVVALFATAFAWVDRATGERTDGRVLAGVDPSAAAAAPAGWGME